MIALVIDIRERQLMEELTTLAIPFTKATLDVGDILIQADSQALLVAERKSHADFAASISDGRYREQRTRLMATRGQGIAVLYFLEGQWSPNLDRPYHGTTESQLQRMTSRLILRYGMPVISTSSVKDTAQWCGRLLAQITDDPTVFHPEGLAAETANSMATYTATFSTVKKANKSAGGTAISMLSVVPGLGAKKVAALLELKSIAELCLMSVEDIAALLVNGKKLGAVAKTLKEALTTSTRP